MGQLGPGLSITRHFLSAAEESLNKQAQFGAVKAENTGIRIITRLGAGLQQGFL